MNDLEVAILKSLHALGGRAEIQQIYNRILRNHVTKLHKSGEIVRVTKGTYCLTEKGCKRLGVEPRAQSNSSRPGAGSVKYCVDNEFGGVVVSQADRMHTSHRPTPKSKHPQRAHEAKPMTTCQVCKSPVRADRLEKHMRKKHPHRNVSAAKPKPKSKVVSAERSMEFPEQAVRQSDFEARYGDKYVGPTRRDYDGTFGSLPLYDDYGDESGPD